MLPRFRWLVSRWGKASCKRHYGAGRPRDPTACKVTQQSLRWTAAPDPSVLDATINAKQEVPSQERLTDEPTCKDEARVGQKGSLEYIWAPIGSRPRMVRDTRHDFAYLFGAICPARAVGVGLVQPFADKAAMSRHLEEIGRHICPGAHGALVMDRAGWHSRGCGFQRT